MRPLLPDLHPNPARVLMLFASALFVGFGFGIVAYFVSGFIYLILVYPVIVSFAGLLIFARLITYVRVNLPRFLLIAGLLFGLATVAAYFYTPYYLWRNREIRLTEEQYQVDTARAAYALDRYLQDEGGLPGIFGFLSMRARAGEGFSNYLIVNSVTVRLLDFTLKDTAAWIYWLVEAGLMIAPLAYFSRNLKLGPFNRSANALYNSPPKQIGTVPIDCLPEFVGALNRGDVVAAAAFIHREDSLDHPILEIYEHHSNGKPGTDHLLSLKSTRRVSDRKVKRQEVGDWELSQAEYDELLS